MHIAVSTNYCMSTRGNYKAIFPPYVPRLIMLACVYVCMYVCDADGD